MLLAIQRVAFAAASPTELFTLTQVLIAMRRNGENVVRLDPPGDLLDVASYYGAAVVHGVARAVETLEMPAAAALGCHPALFITDNVTQDAIDLAVRWGQDALVVIGPDARRARLESALAAGELAVALAVPSLNVSTLRMIAGALLDKVPRTRGFSGHDRGGLPGG